MAFKYRGSDRTAEAAKAKAKEGAGDYDSCWKAGLPVYKPKEGENCVRIMPSTDDENPDWDLIVFSHYNVGPDNGRYLCLNKMKGQQCPVCDAKAQTTDADEADALRSAKGGICWVVDRDNEKQGPQLWAIPFTKVRNEIWGRTVDKRTGAPILIDHPDEGFDVVFSRKGTDVKTQYTGVEVLRDSTPLHDDPKVQAKWLKYIEDNPLASVLNFYEAEYIEKVLLGKAARKKKETTEEVDEETGEITERTSRSRRPEPEEEVQSTRGSRRAVAPVEEEVVENPRETRRGRADAEPANDRASRRRALLPEDDEIPSEEGRRSATRGEPETDEEGEGEPSPVASARRQLDRLKNRSARA